MESRWLRWTPLGVPGLASRLQPSAPDDPTLLDDDFDIAEGSGGARVEPSDPLLHQCQSQNVTPLNGGR